MSGKLVLVDYENVQRIDLSILDDDYRAIVFVGANQQPPKAARRPATAHWFNRVDFLKVEGSGRNALDFHIAFHLGRTFETAPQTGCFVLSRDKGFDPLLLHLNKNGVKCRRIEALEELLPAAVPHPKLPSEPEVACRRCGKSNTIEHHGGRWCTNCGCFASPPNPALLPSLQPGYRGAWRARPFVDLMEREQARMGLAECAWCHERVEMGDGVYDDGEWMCGGCVALHAR
jgi:hypothetical protein